MTKSEKKARAMKKLKHQNASYRNEHGKIVGISVVALNTKDGRKAALAFTFFEPTTKEHLYVKPGKYCLYFARAPLSRGPEDIPERAESTDKNHEHWIEKYYEKLSGETLAGKELTTRPKTLEVYTYKVDIYGFVDKNSEHAIARVSLENYDWGKEVSRVIDGRHGVRHDLFGMDVGLQMLRATPQVAFEMVNTSTPSTVTLQRLIHLTKLVPLIVIIVPVNGEASRHYGGITVENGTARVRCTAYIAQGMVYFNSVPYLITTEAELRARGNSLKPPMFG